MAETAAERPHPDVRGAGREYWRAARSGVLQVQRCDECGHVFWYPRLHCPSCGGERLAAVATSGRGVVHTFTIVRQSGDRFFRTRVPYALAMIELAEGPLVMSNVIDCPAEQVAIGMPVEVTFEPFGEEYALPLFRPVRMAGSR